MQTEKAKRRHSTQTMENEVTTSHHSERKQQTMKNRIIQPNEEKTKGRTKINILALSRQKKSNIIN